MRRALLAAALAACAPLRAEEERMSGQSPRAPGPVRDRATAIAVAMEAVAAADPTTDWVPVEEATRERPFGWVVFYTTRAHRETGEPRFMKPGNGPVAVERAMGQVTMLPSAGNPDFVIGVFEAAWTERQRR
ncbi:hypothetical protein J5Y09_00575 [Roseomonas sp. PWR1]|uniref:Immunity protein 35 domain-containing protein n=1 Tax=Roseomonas nitratireducens TaxID=2820810 RepID=A0ABS4ALZ8_9PROT|nr:YrhB domain-containing protein [Neoroseomonas nitratireducens]MBP0462391.1 hypothetical protein [Neoroseomonas nitratireducens]